VESPFQTLRRGTWLRFGIDFEGVADCELRCIGGIFSCVWDLATLFRVEFLRLFADILADSGLLNDIAFPIVKIFLANSILSETLSIVKDL
jgi:hypothetical protein